MTSGEYNLLRIGRTGEEEVNESERAQCQEKTCKEFRAVFELYKDRK